MILVASFDRRLPTLADFHCIVLFVFEFVDWFDLENKLSLLFCLSHVHRNSTKLHCSMLFQFACVSIRLHVAVHQYKSLASNRRSAFDKDRIPSNSNLINQQRVLIGKNVDETLLASASAFDVRSSTPSNSCVCLRRSFAEGKFPNFDSTSSVCCR